MISADLHLHTAYSDDSTITPKILVERLLAHRIIKVAAVTDHDTTRGISAIRELASAFSDILIIPGVEISTPQGDMLILGAEETPTKPWTAENMVDYARENGCVSVIAHPYREYGMGDAAIDYKVDAIETLNGASPSLANKAAQDLASLMGLPGIAGSDAHQPLELCTVYTEIDAPLNVDDILDAIKKGKVRIPPSLKSIHF